jgi:hypothetical protein
MPSWYRDPDAPTPNRPRKVGVCFLVELDGGVLVDRRSDDGALAFAVTPKPGAAPRLSDESLELRVVSREELAALDLAPAHRPIRDAYLGFDGAVVVA